MLIVRCLQGKSLLPAGNVIRNVIRRWNRAAAKNDTVTKKSKENTNTSQLYPGYKVIYTLSVIPFASFWNVSKRISTILLPFGSATSLIFWMGGIIPNHVAITVAVNLVLVMIWFHVIGFLMTNNIIGFIYYHPAERKVILSYLNYWGQRVDVHTAPEDIVSLSETPVNFQYMLYRILYVTNPKEKLRLHLGKASVMDEENLKQIIGTWK